MDWASLDYEKIANAIVILVVGLAAGLGLRSGKKAISDAKPTSSVELAGALIDSSSANRLASATEQHTAAIRDQTNEMVNYRKSNERVAEKLSERIASLTDEVEELKMEVVRNTTR